MGSTSTRQREQRRSKKAAPPAGIAAMKFVSFVGRVLFAFMFLLSAYQEYVSLSPQISSVFFPSLLSSAAFRPLPLLSPAALPFSVRMG
jgi:hypothetical protein